MKCHKSISILLIIIVVNGSFGIKSTISKDKNFSLFSMPAVATTTAKNSFCKCFVKSRRCHDTGRGPAGGLNQSIPYIISPRRTSVLNNNPTLRWNPVPNATSYKVIVEDVRGNKIWETNQTATEVVYSGKPLEPGIDYSVIVKANGKSSLEEKELEQGFKLLNPDDAYQVRTIVDLLRKQNLSEETKALLLTHVYIQYDLNAEAIETLEVVAKKSQNVTVYRLLGDLYDQVGLNLLAESRYKEAIKLAEAVQDKQGLAITQASLGEVYTTRRNLDDAILWLERSLVGHQALGNIQRATELKERIAKLNQQRLKRLRS